MRSAHVKDAGYCLVSKNVYDEVKAISRLVPEKYQIRFGDALVDLEGVDNSLHTQPNTMLLKEPALYCFFLRCKKPKSKPFMVWIIETALPREVRKLASIIEEKEVAIALLNDDLQGRDNQMQAIKYESVALQAQKDAYHAELQTSQDTITHLKTRYVPHAKNHYHHCTETHNTC